MICRAGESIKNCVCRKSKLIKNCGRRKANQKLKTAAAAQANQNLKTAAVAKANQNAHPSGARCFVVWKKFSIAFPRGGRCHSERMTEEGRSLSFLPSCSRAGAARHPCHPERAQRVEGSLKTKLPLSSRATVEGSCLERKSRSERGKEIVNVKCKM